MYLYKFSCISSSVVCNQFCVNSMCELLEIDLWGELEREKEVYKFRLTEANIPFGSLGDNKDNVSQFLVWHLSLDHFTVGVTILEM